MPKKTKAQKIKTIHRAIPSLVADSSAAIPGIGHFWARNCGLRFLLVSELDQNDGSVTVDFCCVDERRDGIIKYHQAKFETSSVVAEMMRNSPLQWVRGDLNQSTKIIRIGIRIMEALEKELPDGFAEFHQKIADGAKSQLPPGIYPCPVCDAPLVPDLIEAVKDNAKKHFEVYLMCERCRQKKNIGIKRAQYAIPMYLRLKNAFMESQELNLAPAGWNNFERALPVEASAEAIGLLLVQDVLKGVVYALERYMADATVPNYQLNDSHVISALEILRKSIDEEYDLKIVEPYEVNFILESLDEGMALVKQIFQEEVNANPDKGIILNAIDIVLGSVHKHSQKAPQGRNYIEFVCNHM